MHLLARGHIIQGCERCATPRRTAQKQRGFNMRGPTRIHSKRWHQLLSELKEGYKDLVKENLELRWELDRIQDEEYRKKHGYTIKGD